MNPLFNSRFFKIGFWLFVAGCGPLLLLGLLSVLGLLSDPDPNPVGLGLLFFFTFWPAVVLMGIGVIQSFWTSR